MWPLSLPGYIVLHSFFLSGWSSMVQVLCDKMGMALWHSTKWLHEAYLNVYKHHDIASLQIQMGAVWVTCWWCRYHGHAAWRGDSHPWFWIKKRSFSVWLRAVRCLKLSKHFFLDFSTYSLDCGWWVCNSKLKWKAKCTLGGTTVFRVSSHSQPSPVAF